MILIYVTCKDLEEAKKISKTLLEKRLLACVNMFPVKSMYWWKEKINEDEEFALIMKTQKEKFEKIKEEIKKVHSYDVPCIVSFDIKQGNEEFLNWIKKEIKD